MKKATSFLGQGWAFPPTFTRNLNSVLLSSEDQNIKECLNILFSTQEGERVMNEMYGTNLRSYVFDDPDGDLIVSIQDTIRNAVLLYEPRVNLLDVRVSSDEDDPARILIEVTYRISATNSRRNFVYPFHLVEGTNLSQ